MNSTSPDLSPVRTNHELMEARKERDEAETRRREALTDILGESEIAVTLLDGNTLYVNIYCAELLYADGYSIRNGALFQNAK